MQDVLAEGDGGRRGRGRGHEGDCGDDDGLGREHAAPTGDGRKGDADQAAAVFGGDEHGRHHDEHDQRDGEPEGLAAGSRVCAEEPLDDGGGDVSGATDHEGTAGAVVAAGSQRGVEVLLAGSDALTVPGAGRGVAVDDGVVEGGGGKGA
ncbi:hypothetical protein GCM10029978_014070 [Actinoallomurus acanthiterrae]